MPGRTCQKCANVGQHLDPSSDDAGVDYYRCEYCGHGWAFDKKTGRAHIVTVERQAL